MGKSLTAAPLFEWVSPDRPVVLIRRSPQRSCDVRYADKHNVSVEGMLRWLKYSLHQASKPQHGGRADLNVAALLR